MATKTTHKEGWRSRIVAHGEEAPDQLLANPKNWRVHPKEQQAALEGVLDEVGWVQDVVVNRRTGHLVDGHLRVSLALRREEPSVPVVYVDLSEQEEALVLAALDPVAAMAAADKEKLDLLLHEVQTSSAGVQAMLADLAEREGLYFGEGDGGGPAVEDVEPEVDRAGELQKKWGTEVGQLWALGDHRLICGDCTERAVVERVMGGEEADLFISDPPYGVGYVEKAQYMAKRGYGHSRATLARLIENDETEDSDEGVAALLEKVLNLWWRDVLRPGGVFYLCCPPGSPETTFRVVVSGLERIRQGLIWVKNNFVLGRQDYHYRHEPILYGWRAGAAHHAVEDRGLDTVWEIPRDEIDKVHPTMKPLALFERMIENSSDEGNVVADPFLGSGTSLLAAERTGRQCRAVELEPAYVAVTLDRWSRATGRQPELLESVPVTKAAG